MKNVAPVFPSATESNNCFRITARTASKEEAAFAGLGNLCQTWPEVACDHIDELLQEDSLQLRRSAAGLLQVLAKGGAASDLIDGHWKMKMLKQGDKPQNALFLSHIESKNGIIPQNVILDSDPGNACHSLQRSIRHR